MGRNSSSCLLTLLLFRGEPGGFGLAAAGFVTVSLCLGGVASPFGGLLLQPLFVFAWGGAGGPALSTVGMGRRTLGGSSISNHLLSLLGVFVSLPKPSRGCQPFPWLEERWSCEAALLQPRALPKAPGNDRAPGEPKQTFTSAS